MTAKSTAAAQLSMIGWLHSVLGAQDIDYWLFGGWAVDFHVGRVTREHEDVDVAVWHTDLAQLTDTLQASGWVHAPEPGEDGYTGFEKQDVRLELALLDTDETGTVFTPLTQGRGDWPLESFGDVTAELNGVHARVVGLTLLIEDKSQSHDNAAVAAKDRSDVALLSGLITGD